MSEVYKALAHPTRRAILRMLREHEMSAGDIAAQFDLSKPTLTGHFNTLRDAGLVEVQRQGTTLIYRLNASVLEEALLDLMEGFGFLATRPSPTQKAKA
ncbi:autorepressor SdpR family transcription factor [Phenylobacterium sp.]|jgi:DNA-binding transcriptional ArsR family regulator|uniref:autorepressor SdpR family transcription factor n=1 Tax=Phenylobacterium sp. TaxID=1871053 RepID=UPI002F42AA77